jgi:serine/threonine protein kinase
VSDYRDSTVLGSRYRLLRRLGSGGMATVWLAHDERLGREVAVKLLSDVLAGDEAYRRRFEREARVAAGLNHPALVSLLDFGTESERPYLVMELVPGETLAARIAAGAPKLDLRALAGDLLSALAYMHHNQIVHRDIKPANVLIDGDGRARLTDFGIARPENATALTETGQLIGTRAYMAPELMRGEPATPRSDLYSLGIVLREAGAERDPPVASLAGQLTAEDPSARPASADDALAMLTRTAPTLRALATAMTPTEPTAVLAGARPTEPAWGAGNRGRALALAGALALVAVAAVGLALALGDGSDDTPRDSTPAAQERSQRTGDGAAGPAPVPEDEQSKDGAQASCSDVEDQKAALEEQKKAAEEAAGDDKAAKEQIKARFETEKKALEESAKECTKR